jgi:hypothetical protein
VKNKVKKFLKVTTLTMAIGLSFLTSAHARNSCTTGWERALPFLKMFEREGCKYMEDWAGDGNCPEIFNANFNNTTSDASLGDKEGELSLEEIVALFPNPFAHAGPRKIKLFAGDYVQGALAYGNLIGDERGLILNAPFTVDKVNVTFKKTGGKKATTLRYCVLDEYGHETKTGDYLIRTPGSDLIEFDLEDMRDKSLVFRLHKTTGPFLGKLEWQLKVEGELSEEVTIPDGATEDPEEEVDSTKSKTSRNKNLHGLTHKKTTDLRKRNNRGRNRRRSNRERNRNRRRPGRN